MKVSIICSTRGRPELCKRMIESARRTAKTNLEIIVGICNDDNSGYGELDATYMTMPPVPTVDCANRLAWQATGDLVAGIADDCIFATPCWDEALIEHYSKLENKIHVYALRDSRSDNGTPHPIVTKEFIKTMGFMFTPIFLHWFVDTWLSDIAKSNNCFTQLNDYLLIHDKPSDKGIYDETYRRIRDMGWFERDKAVNDTCQHFLGLEKERLKRFLQHQYGTKEHLD